MTPSRSFPRVGALASLALFCAVSAAQEAKQEPAGDAQAKLLAAFAKVGLEVDLAKKTVAMPVKMSRPGDLIEYVLITRRGKAHESLLIVDVQPSLLNAALLALGLNPGTNAIVKDKDPLPSEEEVRNGAEWFTVTPPVGPQVWFALEWKDEAGKVTTCLLDDLLLDLATGEAVEAAEWIYIGGRSAPPYRGEPPVYIADLEGNLVSNFYVDPTNHLVTIKHERGRDDQNWWLTDICPVPGTDIKLTVHVQKPKLAIDREARLAAEKAAGKKPRGPVKDLPVAPASDGGGAPVKKGEAEAPAKPETKRGG